MLLYTVCIIVFCIIIVLNYFSMYHSICIRLSGLVLRRQRCLRPLVRRDRHPGGQQPRLALHPALEGRK